MTEARVGHVQNPLDGGRGELNESSVQRDKEVLGGQHNNLIGLTREPMVGSREQMIT